MNMALNIVKTYAWIKATSNSRQSMKIIITTDTPLSPAPITAPNLQEINITQVSDKTMAWPAKILANKRTIKAKGFVNMPNNSITGIIGTGHLSHVGTLGQKISSQYSLLPNKLMAKKVNMAKTNVMAILPVRLAPPGNIGTSPNKLLRKIKKNAVSKYGA